MQPMTAHQPREFEVLWRFGVLGLWLDAFLAFVASVVHVFAHRVVPELLHGAPSNGLSECADIIVRRVEPGSEYCSSRSTTGMRSCTLRGRLGE